jgi:hypothetical protein
VKIEIVRVDGQPTSYDSSSLHSLSIVQRNIEPHRVDNSIPLSKRQLPAYQAGFKEQSSIQRLAAESRTRGTGAPLLRCPGPHCCRAALYDACQRGKRRSCRRNVLPARLLLLLLLLLLAPASRLVVCRGSPGLQYRASASCPGVSPSHTARAASSVDTAVQVVVGRSSLNRCSAVPYSGDDDLSDRITRWRLQDPGNHTDRRAVAFIAGLRH